MRRPIDREAAEALANLRTVCPSLHRPIADGMAVLRAEAAHYRNRLKDAHAELATQTTDRNRRPEPSTPRSHHD